VRLPDPQRSRIVLIGTSEYEDENLPDLPAVSRSLTDLKVALTDPVFGIVPEMHCDVLADEGDIRLIGRRVRAAARQAEDLLLVYYAGHGLTAGRRHELYLGLRHTEWDEPEFNALEYDKLRSAVLNSPAAAKMIILDCCFSGRVFGHSMAAPAAELIDKVEIDGSYVLASAHGNEISLVLPGEDHTAFTGRLLRLLRDGVHGGPEFLTIDDLYRHLRARMRAEGLPQPQKRGTDTADLLALARNRAYDATVGPILPEHQMAAGEQNENDDWAAAALPQRSPGATSLHRAKEQMATEPRVSEQLRELRESVDEVARPLDDTGAAQDSRRASVSNRAGPLSAREKEVVALLAGGASNAKIAHTLFVTPNTVRSHLDRIRDKTGARSRTELTRYAIQAGIEPVVPSW
jgi:DNA-binding CsgD family transcriptional regulator